MALAVVVAAAAALVPVAARASAQYDLRGTWDTYGSGGGYSGTFSVTAMNLATGAFSGTGDGTSFVLKGVEHGSSVTFTQSQGGYVSHDTATVVMSGGKLQMTGGTWHDSNGSGGTFSAALKSSPAGSGTGPTPVAGQSVAAGAVSGTVLVKRPGATAFTALTTTAVIPVGSTVDATHGRVKLTSAAGGRTYSGQFYDGEFTLSQNAAGVTKLTLAGGVPCAAGASDPKRAPLRKRSLWGSAHGKFETSGHYAAATELGTRWLTADRCTGTLIRVAAGAVRVTDLVRHRSFVLHAPHQRLVRS